MASEISEAETSPKVEEITPERRGTKRDSPELVGEEAANGRRRRKNSLPETTPVERPTRERKAVERFSEEVLVRSPAAKSISIQEGSGTKLKDIPNVAFMLSKRRVDDNIQALHILLYGKKSHVQHVKRNICQFSGFVWPENEVKLRAKLKEKLDKINKVRLVDFCELLDVPISKSTAKKEDVVSKLAEFLESPHTTRDVILADKDKKRKKRARTVKGDASSDKEAKNSESKVQKRKRRTSKAEKQQEDDDEDGLADTKDKSTDEEVGSHSGEEEDIHDEDENEEPSASQEQTEEAERADKPIAEGTTPVSKITSSPAEDEPEANVETLEGKDGSKKEKRMVRKTTSKEDKKKPQKKGSAVDVSDTSPSALKENGKKAKSNEKAERGDEPMAEETTPVIIGSPAKSGESPTRSISKNTSAPTEHEAEVNVETLESKDGSRKQKKVVRKTNAKKDAKKPQKKGSALDVSDASPSAPSKSIKENGRKAKSNEKSVKEKTSRKNAEANSGARVSKRGQGKGKTDAGPTAGELRSVLTTILKKVDFNSATVADILKELGTHFNRDMMDRKAEVKQVIEEVISNMTSDEESEEADADENDDSGDNNDENGDGDAKEEADKEEESEEV